MGINLRTIVKSKQIMEQIGNFFRTVDFSATESRMSNLKIFPSYTLYNIKTIIFTRLSFLLPERLPHSSFPVEVASPIQSINYGLVSQYSGNWSAPRRTWFRRNWSRIDILRCAVTSNNQGHLKLASNNTDANTPKSQEKIKIEEPKISGAENKMVSSNSSEAEILDIGANLRKAKSKESEAKAEVTNRKATVDATDAKLGKVSAKVSGLKLKKELSEKNVAEKKLSTMQAKLGVVEAKLSEPPQAKFSGADYALKPKELLREISQCRQAKTQKKIVTGNVNETSFFKKIKKFRLDKWKKFPKTRMEGSKCKKSPKNEESPKN